MKTYCGVPGSPCLRDGPIIRTDFSVLSKYFVSEGSEKLLPDGPYIGDFLSLVRRPINETITTDLVEPVIGIKWCEGDILKTDI